MYLKPDQVITAITHTLGESRVAGKTVARSNDEHITRHYMVLALVGPILARFVPAVASFHTLVHTLIISALAWLCFQRPFWGIITIVSLTPLVRLFPQVPFPTLFAPVLGAATGYTL